MNRWPWPMAAIFGAILIFVIYECLTLTLAEHAPWLIVVHVGQSFGLLPLDLTAFSVALVVSALVVRSVNRSAWAMAAFVVLTIIARVAMLALLRLWQP